MTAARPRRSALYLPATNSRALEKARTLPCDVVILDLEDAVAPEAKDDARTAAVEAVRAGGFDGRELVVRVNGLDTPWGAQDLIALGDVSPDAVLIPKVSSAKDLRACNDLAPGLPLWAMFETCLAVLQADALAAACADYAVRVWVLGTNDLAKEMRCTLTTDREPLKPALATAVMAARAYGLTVLDGVFNDIADTDGLTQQCAQAQAYGFDGKSLIHPSQIEAANQAFTPDPEAVARARAVIHAFAQPENAGRGVIKVDGRMVERLHLTEAERLMAVSEAIAARGN